MTSLPKTKAKWLAGGVAAVVALGCVGVVAAYGVANVIYHFQTSSEMENLPAPTSERIAHGEYLARVGDCVACHTASGGKPFSGGLPLDTGFGVVLSSNITPDKDTGIGSWSMKQFFLAMRHGQGEDGKRLYPAMPYNTYARVSDDDIIDIKYYLDTLSPVTKAVDSNQMKFPFNIRPLMIGWNMLFLDTDQFEHDATKSAEWNRGRYIVDGLGHCTTCHSPKNIFGGDGTYLSGAVLQDWHAPNINGNGWPQVAEWSEEDIAEYLKTGVNRHAIASGPMAEAIQNSTQHMEMSDLHAVATYLKSLESSGPNPMPALATATAPSHTTKLTYNSLCATCHSAEGNGVKDLGPALRGNTAILGPGGASTTLRMILSGGYSAKTGTHPTGFAMPAFDWKLNDHEAADLANYIRSAWGNVSPAISADEVKAMRTKLASTGQAD
ncbi:c-type cytochrome [Agrobacterium rhizogenes]|nr:c-type cytochrome [Rhizobium rhizogenes]NTJ79421.1 c-type cytochrome [Rhizobium rhizogenes]